MHKSVLVDEVLNFLKLSPGARILDATVGCGGHAKEILNKISPGGKLIGIDCDKEALNIAGEMLKDFNNVELIHGNFKNLDAILDKLHIKSIDGALFDLGVSSLQLDNAARGFSFRSSARLDMRMDQTLGESAYDYVNRAREQELDEALKNFGEERYHRRIARAIIEYRKKRLIQDTTELSRIIYENVPWSYRRQKIDAATRTFQAIRIAVNDELKSLRQGLDKITPYLNPGARLVVISFHSLEDRIVKHHFRDMVKKGVYAGLTKKPVTAGESQLVSNPRAKSAKLRAVEKNA
ncbi:MAG: 16S rRNA (cytosine(1402)-N(4))-methyltransferase RsmH [Candidatus Omnitrophota bacterium]